MLRGLPELVLREHVEPLLTGWVVAEDAADAVQDAALTTHDTARLGVDHRGAEAWFGQRDRDRAVAAWLHRTGRERREVDGGVDGPVREESGALTGDERRQDRHVVFDVDGLLEAALRGGVRRQVVELLEQRG